MAEMSIKKKRPKNLDLTTIRLPLPVIHVFRPRFCLGRRGFVLHGFRSFSLSDGVSHLGGSFFPLLVHPVGKGKDGAYANRPAYEGF